MISQRLRGIGQDGEEIEGLAPKLKKEFKEIANIDIEDSQGNLRSTYDILSDMAKVFPTLTDKQRQYLGELAAGNRQVRVLNAIIGGWEDVEQAIDSATNSQGSALDENEKVLDSVTGRINAFRSAFEQLSQTTISSEWMKFFIELGTVVLKTTDAFGGLIPVFLAFTVAYLTFSEKKVGKFWQSLILKIINYTSQVKGATYSTIALSTSMKVASAALSAGLLIGIPLLIGFLSKLSKTSEEVLETAKSNLQETTSKLESVTSELESVGQKIDELNAKKSPTFVDKEELADLRETSGELERQKALLDEIARHDAENLASAALEDYNKDYGRFDVSEGRIDEIRDSMRVDYRPFTLTAEKNDVASLIVAYEEYSKQKKEALESGDLFRYDALDSEVNHIREMISDVWSDYEAFLSDTSKHYDNLQNTPLKELTRYDKELIEEYEKVSSMIDVIHQQLNPAKWAEIKFFDIYDSEEFEQVKARLEKLAVAGKLDESTISNISEFQTLMEETGLSAEDVVNQINAMVESTESLPDTFAEFDLKSFSEDIDSMQSSYDTLSSAMDEYNEYGAYSLDTLQSLLELEPQYLAMLEMQNGQLVLNEESMQRVITAKLNTAKANLYEEATTRLNELASESLARANSEVADGADTYVGASESRANATISETNAAWQATVAYQSMNEAAIGAESAGVSQFEINKIISETEAKVEALNSAISGVSFNLGGAAKGFDKVSKSAEKANKEVDGLKDKLNSLNGELDRYKQAHSAIISLLDDEIDKLQEIVDLERERLEAQKETMDSALSAVDRVYEDEINRLRELVDLEQKRLDIKKEGYEATLRAVDKVYSDEISRLQELIDLEQKRLSKKKDNYDATLSAVNKLYSDEISHIEEQKSAVEDSYNEKMDLIQAEIDALQDKNEETSKEIALEKAKLNLHNAQSQRNKLIYDKDKGYVFTADQSAINEAKENLEEAELNLRLKRLNNLKDELNKSLAEEVKVLDDSIKALNEYKDHWADVSSQYADTQNAMIASQTLGAGWERDLLNGRMRNYDSFLDDYNNVQAQLNDIEDEATANQERIKQLEEYRQKWSDVVDSYSTEQDRLNATQLLGKNWEQNLLSGRLGNLNSFLGDYNRVQKELNDISGERTANQLRINEMERYRQKWSDVVSAYSREQDRLNAKQLLGKDWEQNLLSGRTTNLNSFLRDYNRIQAQLNDISKERTANQQRINELTRYKNAWVDVVKEYERQQNRLMAGQLLGKNWEQDVLKGRISALTTFKSKYINLQKQIADYENRVAKSAKSAEAAASAVARATKRIQEEAKKISNTKIDQRVPRLVTGGGGSNPVIKYSKYAKGGVVSLGSEHLNSLARSVGEDTMVAVKEGERILTPQQNQSYEKLINLSEQIVNSGVARMFEQYQPHSSTSNLQPINKSSQQAVTFTGDIILQGVQNPEEFGKALKSNIKNIIKQNFN